MEAGKLADASKVETAETDTTPEKQVTEPEVIQATLIEPEVSDKLDITAYEPGSPIEANFAAVRRYITERLALYQGEHSITDDDGYRVAKSSRTAMTRLKSEIDSERKRIKSLYMEPIEAFEKQVKELLAPVDETRAAIDAAVKTYEAEWERRKAAALASYYAELAPWLTELVPYQRIQDYAEGQGKKWMNRTYQEMQARTDIEQIITEIGTNERTIDKLAHDSAEAEVVKAEYFQSLDFAAATRQLEHLESQRAKLAELEARREEQRAANEVAAEAAKAETAAMDAIRRAKPVETAPEPAQAPAQAPTVTQPTLQPADMPVQVHRWYCSFDGSVELAQQVAKALQSLGITGGKITKNKETLR